MKKQSSIVEIRWTLSFYHTPCRSAPSTHYEIGNSTSTQSMPSQDHESRTQLEIQFKKLEASRGDTHLGSRSTRLPQKQWLEGQIVHAFNVSTGI